MSLHFPLKSVLRTTPAHLKKLTAMGIDTVQDLLEYFPRTIESTDTVETFADVQLGVKGTFHGTLHNVRSETTPRQRRKLYKASLHLKDKSAIEVVWFRAPYQLKSIKEGTDLYLVGKVARNYGTLQLSNPEIHLQESVHVGGIRAIYVESPPITSKWLREKIAPLLSLTSDIHELLPEDLLDAENLMGKREAVKQIHHPESTEAWSEARRRLAFEEMFVIQMRVTRGKIMRQHERENPHKVIMDPEVIKKDLAELPFELTTAQKKVLYQILKDFEAPNSAHRLVQGDVGSGKTIVAFLAGLQMIRAGFQFAILSPTEILAKQHFANALKYFPAEFHTELLTGSVTAKNKERIKSQLKNGDIKVLIGTHAMLTEDTIFQNLGLAIIDEQHRFGVHQRSVLGQNHAHTVAMTATPIPRTLALTIYGDQDLSVIDEMPPGRKPVITRVVADEKTTQLCNTFIDDQIGKERQIFWICPLIDESDTLELKNVKSEYERIANEVFPHRRVDFLHGKMKSKEKDAVMKRFRDREFDILVSTSVIEVGVDIPNATVMVIENSERFGLAQLHQFRGRIGRNDMQSYCFLMVGKDEAKHTPRLRAMEKSNDGMYLAKVDLKLRGMGELYGIRQSGLPDFKCADITDLITMQKTHSWAEKILEEDFELTAYPELRKAVEAEGVYF